MHLTTTIITQQDTKIYNWKNKYNMFYSMLIFLVFYPFKAFSNLFLKYIYSLMIFIYTPLLILVKLFTFKLRNWKKVQVSQFHAKNVT